MRQFQCRSRLGDGGRGWELARSTAEWVLRLQSHKKGNWRLLPRSQNALHDQGSGRKRCLQQDFQHPDRAAPVSHCRALCVDGAAGAQHPSHSLGAHTSSTDLPWLPLHAAGPSLAPAPRSSAQPHVEMWESAPCLPQQPSSLPSLP